MKYLLLLIPAFTLLAGCTAAKHLIGNGTNHLYEGEKKPVNEISIIEFNSATGWGHGNGVVVRYIDGEIVPTFSQSKKALLPGDHKIDYECNVSKDSMPKNTQGRKEVTVTLAKGVHYLLVGDVYSLPPTKWYYSTVDVLPGITDQKLNKYGCNLRLIPYKRYGMEDSE
ncbi:MAG: hypothetical protein CMI00_00020 [Oceanospirillaceae bacterium]|nr:hypothetical protein [Oceanospirillaceae bacterium]|tara:strand:- start:3223 stop:3729 length:507 start_codon:yes stop_codon:yes gene_type:complete